MKAWSWFAAGGRSVARGRVKALFWSRRAVGGPWFARRWLSYCHISAQAGYPVICGLSLQSQMPLEYWIPGAGFAEVS